MRGNPIRGAGYLFRGFSQLVEPGYRLFVLVPLMLNVILFSGAIYLLTSQFEVWMDYLLSGMPSWLSFLDWLIWPLFAIMVLAVVYYGFTLVTNLIAAPFNGLLSERVESKLRGERPTQDPWQELLAVLPRTLARELAKLGYYLPRFLLLVVVTFIPVVNLISPLLWFSFGAWMMAIQYCDYPMDNNKVTFKEMLKLLRGQSLTCFGFGGVVQLLMVIPLVNLVLMPSAVIGATIYWVEEFTDE